MSNKSLSVPQQITKALDGRSQRWLALQVKIPETDFSKRMHERVLFTDEELKKINAILKSEVKYKKQMLLK